MFELWRLPSRILAVIVFARHCIVLYYTDSTRIKYHFLKPKKDAVDEIQPPFGGRGDRRWWWEEGSFSSTVV